MLPLPLLLVAVLPTIWIVDASNGPGTNFTDLPAAVAAAVSGDTILVRAGTYSVLNVSGKALTIRGADWGATVVTASAQNIIQQVPAGSHFYLSGMVFLPSNPSNFSGWPGLEISGSTTEVVLADVTAVCANAYFLSNATGGPGLYVSGGAVVHAARCSFTGGGGGMQGQNGHGAVVNGGCRLAADASMFVAPPSNPGDPFGHGGSGLLVFGTATLSRSSAYGGPGFFGGAGIAVISGFARVTGTSADSLVGSLAYPGLEGQGLSVGQNGSAIVHGNVTLGPPGFGFTGPVAFDPVPLPYLSVAGSTTPGGEFAPGQPVTITFDGAIPSAPFVCIVDVAPGFSTALALVAVGELLLPPPTFYAIQGTLDAVGHSQSTITPAVAVPGLTGIPLHAQFGAYDAVAGKFRLSNGYIRIFQ